MATFALVLTVVLFLLGLAGTVLPVLPGATLIYAGMLVYGLLTRFATLNTAFFLIQGIALLLVFSLDYLATATGARRFGGSRYAAWGAALGIVPGALLFGPFGLIIGPFLGAVLGELAGGRKPAEAVRAGFGSLIGFVGGTVLKLSVEILMIIWFFMNI